MDLIEKEILDNDQEAPCGIKNIMSVIGGKWKIRIIYALYSDINRFGIMHRHIPGISKKMLTDNLRELESDGIIDRKVYPQVPPKVIYSLTELGKSLNKVIHEMNKWGLENEGVIRLQKRTKRFGNNA